jgi:antitoxin PrlF
MDGDLGGGRVGGVSALVVRRKTYYSLSMVTAISKLSTKAQTVLPKLVREKLGLEPGDSVRFVIEDDRVTLLKHTETEDDPFHAFTEWASAEDERAYGKL